MPILVWPTRSLPRLEGLGGGQGGGHRQVQVCVSNFEALAERSWVVRLALNHRARDGFSKPELTPQSWAKVVLANELSRPERRGLARAARTGSSYTLAMVEATT
jgi:hypothetical protein